ncbi:DUF4398 domain-containing protein [Stenotrophomonas sp. GbtcB23]|uniref:DUF4398 domain-containing protein n=1 Tax=Stenotrophomonas sp. GbtcB23 TaxID=2824768 RepID=UPI001C2FFEF7|nr:DUF4398 domain-containing protein [Stenotrophomonas sp. GbtcB23]
MNPSFAQMRRTPYVVLTSCVMACAFALAGTALAQDGALELMQARQAVDKATQADADQYAPDLIAVARQGLEQAQAAAGDRRERKNAPALAVRATADADLARARSEEATATAQLQLRRNEVTQLERQLAGEDRR